MNIEQTKHIKIHEYLASLGIQPVKQRGANLTYHSPYRSDKNPSFSIHVEKNIWNDFGTGEKGDLIHLVQLIHNNCSVAEALHHLNNATPVPINFSLESKKDSSLTIVKVTELKNKALIEYLNSRGLDANIVGKFLNDVYYQIGDRRYFAVGFKNNSGGFELRSKYTKISTYPKDIRTVLNDSDECCIFEGWPDFLTYLQYVRVKESDYCVLNSIAMVNRAVETLRKYKKVFYWGQNDEPGKNVLDKLLSITLPVIDCRCFYENFKDLNEKYRQSNIQ